MNLYSRDFYELCRERLAPAGLMAQWWPLPAQNDEDSRSLVRAFLDVFPYASAWSTELHEVLLIGALRLEFFLHADKVLPRDGLERVDWPAIALCIGNHHEHFAAQLTQLKAVGFEILEFRGAGVFTSAGHRLPWHRLDYRLQRWPRPSGMQPVGNSTVERGGSAKARRQ